MHDQRHARKQQDSIQCCAAWEHLRCVMNNAIEALLASSGSAAAGGISTRHSPAAGCHTLPQ